MQKLVMQAECCYLVSFMCSYRLHGCECRTVLSLRLVYWFAACFIVVACMHQLNALCPIPRGDWSRTLSLLVVSHLVTSRLMSNCRVHIPHCDIWQPMLNWLQPACIILQGISICMQCCIVALFAFLLLFLSYGGSQGGLHAIVIVNYCMSWPCVAVLHLQWYGPLPYREGGTNTMYNWTWQVCTLKYCTNLIRTNCEHWQAPHLIHSSLLLHERCRKHHQPGRLLYA